MPPDRSVLSPPTAAPLTTNAAALTVPFTSSVVRGMFVPIPTLPALVTTMRVVPAVLRLMEFVPVNVATLVVPLLMRLLLALLPAPPPALPTMVVTDCGRRLRVALTSIRVALTLGMKLAALPRYAHVTPPVVRLMKLLALFTRMVVVPLVMASVSSPVMAAGLRLVRPAPLPINWLALKLPVTLTSPAVVRLGA